MKLNWQKDSWNIEFYRTDSYNIIQWFCIGKDAIRMGPIRPFAPPHLLFSNVWGSMGAKQIINIGSGSILSAQLFNEVGGGSGGNTPLLKKNCLI